MKTFERRMTFLFASFMILILFLPASRQAQAAYIPSPLDGISYQIDNSDKFSFSDDNMVEKLCYGDQSLGNLFLQGTVDDQNIYDDMTICSASSELTISYHYFGNLKGGAKEDWNLTGSDSKSLNGVNLKKKMEIGAVVVQCSTGGEKWETKKILTDAFGDNKSELNAIYTISEEDVRAGMNYRVLIGYRLQKKTGTSKILWLIPTDKYSYTNIIEKYDFYVTYSKNAVVLREIMTGQPLSGKKETENGFIIDKGGTEFEVRVTKDHKSSIQADDLLSITDPGEYTIDITSETKKEYSFSMKVTKGLDLTETKPIVYDRGSDGGFREEKPVNGKTAFGLDAITSLKIAQRSGSTIGNADHDGFQAFGIMGDTAGIFLQLHTNYDDKWNVKNDSWGKEAKQAVNGVYIGKIDSGALLIQKSTDGQNWVALDSGVYANGLFTTDYYTYYNDKGDVLIYQPNGSELLNGLYLKISYAYKMHDQEKDTNCRFLEVYNLFLCSNDLDAVTIHNLSVKDNLKSYLGEDEEIQYEVFKQIESLQSGSCTVSGFQIDTSLNPTTEITVKRNGENYYRTEKNEYVSDGKYDITLRSPVGKEKKLVIYVDKQNSEYTMKSYFGDGFITGKRLYSEGDYPAFQSKRTSWNLSAQPDFHLPLNGSLKNTTTGYEQELHSQSKEQTDIIREVGHYIAKFSTKPSNVSSDLPGDYKEFTFEFDVIGSDPGPTVNKRNLEQYSRSTIVDSYPKYYGVTYPSAGKGYITLAFSTRDAARSYAYSHEKGEVEKQADGSFRYKGAAMNIGQKVKYDSTWDLTDAINYFADMAVQEGCFDASDPFTCRTLRQAVSDHTENLRTLELSNSVIVFADAEQKAELCNLDSALPIISPKSVLYQETGINGAESSDYLDFQFVRDNNGLDSNSVVIIDCNGKTYSVGYGRKVGEYLRNEKCPTGIVTIKEQNTYGATASYQAVYFAENENTAQLSLTYYSKVGQEQQVYTQSDNKKSIIASAFSIASLKDDLDPYALIRVERLSGNESPEYCVADQIPSKIWSDEDVYEVKVINHSGYCYTINIEIKDSDFASVSFEGPGTENVQPLLTSYQAHDVSLPHITRYGYDLVGFKDTEGKMYFDKISEIVFKGSKVLETVWKAKRFKLHLVDETGKELKLDEIEFGDAYELPTPTPPDGLAFVGWAENDNQLSDRTYTLTEEKDVTLVALTQPVPVVSSATELSSENSNHRNYNHILLFGTGGFLFCLFIIIAIRKKSKVANAKSDQTAHFTYAVQKPQDDTDKGGK